MDEHGVIENVNLSGIEFTDEGDSVTLHLVGMVPPYKHCRFQCHNVYSFILHRSPDDQIPYYVGELVWRDLREEEKEAALEKVKYPIFNQNGSFFALGRVVTVHVEGGACCDILAEKVTLIETPTSGGKP